MSQPNEQDFLLPYEYYFPFETSNISVRNPDNPYRTSKNISRNPYNETTVSSPSDPPPNQMELMKFFAVLQWIDRNPVCSYYCGLHDPLPPPHPLPYPINQSKVLRSGYYLTNIDSELRSTLSSPPSRNVSSSYPFVIENKSDPVPLNLLTNYYKVLQWRSRNPLVPLDLTISL